MTLHYSTIGEMYSLTQDQIDYFHENGFLVVTHEEHQLFDKEDIQRWTSEIEGWPRQSNKWMPYDEINSKGERQLMRVERFADYHQDYNKFMRGESLTHVLSQLTGKVGMMQFAFSPCLSNIVLGNVSVQG